jgi:hypothetical protein
VPLADEAKQQAASHGNPLTTGGVHSPLMPPPLLADHNNTVAVYGIDFYIEKKKHKCPISEDICGKEFSEYCIHTAFLLTKGYRICPLFIC